jgi:TatA/E family protein of Tat protein translocase
MPFVGNFGPTELIIILVIALVVLGPGKLPEVGSALGKSIREFRKAASDVKDATSLEPIKSSTPPDEPPRVTPPPTVTPAAPPAASEPSGQGEPVAAAPARSDSDSPAS